MAASKTKAKSGASPGVPRLDRILAIETSCDDTSVAIVDHSGSVLAMVSADQNAVHAPYGGVVPEIACRNHTYHLLPLIERCLQRAGLDLAQMDGIAVTSEPGLVGSLLVGLVTAKSLSLSLQKPFIGVNHLEGHLLAPFLCDDQYSPPEQFDYPYVALAISGGHTSLYRIAGLGEYEVLGHTVDDAAGEAFDKFGKMLGLGFPGGVRVDRCSQGGDVTRFSLPRAMLREEHFDFSFSGLKASAQRLLDGLTEGERADLDGDVECVNKLYFELQGLSADRRAEAKLTMRSNLLADLCASYQEAIVDVLLERLSRACRELNLKRAVLTGGVSANSRLRARALAWAEVDGVQLVVPPLRYCTDNAAMIGLAGILRLNRGEFSPQTLGPRPRAPLGVPRERPGTLVRQPSKREPRAKAKPARKERDPK